MDDKISPTTNGIRCGLNADDDQPKQTPHDPNPTNPFVTVVDLSTYLTLP